LQRVFCCLVVVVVVVLAAAGLCVCERERETRTDGRTDGRTGGLGFLFDQKESQEWLRISQAFLYGELSPAPPPGAPAVTARVCSWLCRTLSCLFCLVITSFLPCLAWLVTCGRNSCYNYLLLLPSAWLPLVKESVPIAGKNTSKTHSCNPAISHAPNGGQAIEPHVSVQNYTEEEEEDASCW
jgi:hypothetical protein